MVIREDGHEMENKGLNAFVCKRCGMDSMTIKGIQCPGVRGKHVCPWQRQIDTNGHCTQLFDTQAEAGHHWVDAHECMTGAEACEHFGLPNWLQRVNASLTKAKLG
jgi:hypothetical protein